MSRLGWTADGIERARAAGGIELERYQRPGFTGGQGVRRSQVYAAGIGIAVDPEDLDPWYEDRRSSRKSGDRV